MAANEDLIALGREIRRHRKALNLSQEALADSAGLHRTYISLLERGQRNPSLEVIAALADGLNTTMSSLVGALDR